MISWLLLGPEGVARYLQGISVPVAATLYTMHARDHSTASPSLR